MNIDMSIDYTHSKFYPVLARDVERQVCPSGVADRLAELTKDDISTHGINADVTCYCGRSSMVECQIEPKHELSINQRLQLCNSLLGIGFIDINNNCNGSHKRL